MRSKKKDLIFLQKNFIYSSFCYVIARKRRVDATGLQSDFDFNSLRRAENRTRTVTISLVLERKDSGAREKCIHEAASAGKHLRERYMMLDHYIQVTVFCRYNP